MSKAGDIDSKIEELKQEKEKVEIEPGLKKLKEFPLSEYENQQILIIAKRKGTYRRDSILQRLDNATPINITKYLGILKEPFLTENEETFTVVTEKHAVEYSEGYGGWILKEGSIENPLTDLKFLEDIDEKSGIEEGLRDVFGGSFEGRLRIYVGDDNVKEQFIHVDPIKKKLKEKKEEKYEPHYDLDYVDILNMLELEIPKDFQIRYEKKQDKERLNIVFELKKLTSQDSELQGQIDSIYSSIKKGGYLKDGAITIVEDKDDAMVVSMGKRMKQDETHKKISRHLGRAFELDMHNSTTEINLGFGMRLNIGEYVTELGSYYDVKPTS